MKTKTRILSALLTVFLLLSALATGSVAAEDTPAMPGKVLYEEDFVSVMEKLGWAYGTQGYTSKTFNLAIDDNFGEAGNKALRFMETAEGWCGIEMVSAEKMTGVTKYSISADMRWEKCATFAFRFGDTSVSNGDFAGISWHETLWNVTGGADSASTNYKNPEVIRKNKTIHLDIQVDAEAGTVALYVDGTNVTTRDNATKKVGTIYLLVRGLTAWMDNICVKNEKTGTVIYSEDFESVQNGHLDVDPVYAGNLELITVTGGKLNINRPGEYGSWGVFEVVPASAIGSTEKYVVSYDLTVNRTWNHHFLMTFGSSDNGNAERNVISYHYDGNGEIFSNLVAGKEKLCNETYGTFYNKPMHVQFEVNATTGVATLWINGVRYGSLTNPAFKNGGIGLGAANNTVATVDNLVVTAGTVADLAQLRYIGVQESAVKDGTYAVRFVGALGDDVALENYTEVGFKVTATWGADGTKTLDTACTTIYGKITGSADGVTSEYRADSFGAKYLFALAVEGIPTDAGQITFTVTPYYVTAAGTVTGNACTVIYNAGALVSQTAN